MRLFVLCILVRVKLNYNYVHTRAFSLFLVEMKEASIERRRELPTRNAATAFLVKD